jgi:hypothetical protein
MDTRPFPFEIQLPYGIDNNDTASTTRQQFSGIHGKVAVTGVSMKSLCVSSIRIADRRTDRYVSFMFLTSRTRLEILIRSPHFVGYYR